MLKIKTWYPVGVILGIVVAAVGLVLLRGEGNRVLAGVMVAVGAGLFGMAGGEWIATMVRQRNPSLARHVNVETADERNLHINSLAKGRAFDTMGWLFPALILIIVLTGVDFWLTLLLIAGYAAQWILYIIHLAVLQKKM